MKKKITLKNAYIVEPPKEKQMIITEFSTACVGCVYSSHPNECLACKYKPYRKVKEKNNDSN